MTGILLLGVVAIWLVVVLLIARWVARRLFSSPGFKLFSFVVLVPMLLLMPLADELIGAFQFDALCKKYTVQVVDEQHVLNARVLSVGGKGDWYAANTAVRIRIQPWTYLDTSTQKVVVSYHTLHAEGGWLIRALGISETNSPLLFSRSCAPTDERSFIKKFNVTITN